MFVRPCSGAVIPEATARVAREQSEGHDGHVDPRPARRLVEGRGLHPLVPARRPPGGTGPTGHRLRAVVRLRLVGPAGRRGRALPHRRQVSAGHGTGRAWLPPQRARRLPRPARHRGTRRPTAEPRPVTARRSRTADRPRSAAHRLDLGARRRHRRRSASWSGGRHRPPPEAVSASFGVLFQEDAAEAEAAGRTLARASAGAAAEGKGWGGVEPEAVCVVAQDDWVRNLPSGPLLQLGSADGKTVLLDPAAPGRALIVPDGAVTLLKILDAGDSAACRSR